MGKGASATSTGGSKKKKYWSVALLVTLGGGIIALTKFGQDWVTKFIGLLQQGIDAVSAATNNFVPKVKVTGTNIIMVLWTLKGAAMIAPTWFRRYTTFLHEKGLEPAYFIVAGIMTAAMIILFDFWGCAFMAMGFAGRFMPSMSVPSGGVSRVDVSMKGLEIVDSLTREIDLSTVDAWTEINYIGATAKGELSVPTEGQYLSEIEINAAADMDNTPTAGLRGATAIRMSGNAIAVGGTHMYLGPAFSCGGKTAGGAAATTIPVRLPTKIKTKGGDKMTLEGIMMWEDVGTITIVVTLTFTKNKREHGIEDGDIRESDVADVDTWTELTYVGTSSKGTPKVPTAVKNLNAITSTVGMGVATDSTGCHRGAAVMRLTGVALSKGGAYQFSAGAVSVQIATTGLWYISHSPETNPVNIDVKGGDELGVEVMMIGEDPGDISVAVGLLYGDISED